MRGMYKAVVCLMAAILISGVLTTPANATTADYYDIGFAKFNGVYVNRIGYTIPNVIKRGIDVSSFQGDIDWSKVATDDISFAFIRCGNTKSGPDLKYEYNVTNALANGIEVGIYYASYAPNEEVAKMEALYAINCASGKNITLPIVYDVEGRALASLGSEQLKKNVKAFCDTVKEAGYKPMVYSSKSFLNTYIGKPECDVWVARYGDVNDYENKCRFWQCSSHGMVMGIEGRVDLNFQYY